MINQRHNQEMENTDRVPGVRVVGECCTIVIDREWPQFSEKTIKGRAARPSIEPEEKRVQGGGVLGFNEPVNDKNFLKQSTSGSLLITFSWHYKKILLASVFVNHHFL